MRHFIGPHVNQNLNISLRRDGAKRKDIIRHTGEFTINLGKVIILRVIMLNVFTMYNACS